MAGLAALVVLAGRIRISRPLLPGVVMVALLYLVVPAHVSSECTPHPHDILGVYAARQPSLTHAAAMATLEGRRFALVAWTVKGQQPIRVRPAYALHKRS